jgi:hypothetical protein
VERTTDRGRRRPYWAGARGCAAGLVGVGLALTLGVASVPAATALSFAAPKIYPTGSGAQAVAIADLNGDGKPDLVTANVAQDTDSVLLNRGDGRFRAANDFEPGKEPESVAIGDLNGDGKPDIATASWSSPDTATVSVLLNIGGGTFSDRVDYPAIGEPDTVAIADLNGDGKLDFATADSAGMTASVFLNQGGRSFRRVDYATGSDPGAVAIGDLNGDRKPDLVTANRGSDTVSVLLNGGGSFQAKRDYRTGRGPISVAIADLNGDGKLDLATADEDADDTVSVLLNAGDGSFGAARDYQAGKFLDSVAAGDLNGDGKPDLVTDGTRGTKVPVLLNNGDGSFQVPRTHETGTDPAAVATGDLNGDGQRDIVTASWEENSVSVLLNTTRRCTVPKVAGRMLSAAKRAIVHAHCRVGTIRRAYSKVVGKGRVISQRPRPGTALPGGGKVDLVVSRGRRQ